MRNGIALTFTLGLGFVVGFLPVLSSNDPSQVNQKRPKVKHKIMKTFLKYVFVILNTLSGVVIFLNVWILPKIRDWLKKRNPENNKSSYISSSELKSSQHMKKH